MVSATEKSKSDNWQLLGLEMSLLGWAVAVTTLVLWVVIGFMPMFLQPDLSRAGVMGDSFGMVNSLFSGLGFTFAAYAIILQIRESHESREQQSQLQRQMSEQTRIAAETALLQKAMRDDDRRSITMQAFLKINRDLLRFRHAFLEMHPQFLTKVGVSEADRVIRHREYLDAFTELRSNCLALGLLFDHKADEAGRALESIFMGADALLRLNNAIQPAADCERMMNEKIFEFEQLLRPLWESLNGDS